MELSDTDTEYSGSNDVEIKKKDSVLKKKNINEGDIKTISLSDSETSFSGVNVEDIYNDSGNVESDKIALTKTKVNKVVSSGGKKDLSNEYKTNPSLEMTLIKTMEQHTSEV